MASFVKHSPAISCLTFLLAITGTSPAQSIHQDFVHAHKAARSHVGVVPHVWYDTVMAYAQIYASKHADSGYELEHSMGPYGELSGEDAVKMWVGESANYDHRSNACIGGMCLHYMQVMWRSSIHLGYARVN
ncbi:basic form of pathogenesis-related protein 1-like [Rhodamnia argentea]|uniref:Basic form of pathogenesis-related protein 1-like n=1 Tax=Rhodamnia argentea TaxID=178133 RepID=A0ABM3HE12_9MYRT|nr:basic form of pathogenesis-related protein 1-like [Rhodamnia argentea]